MLWLGWLVYITQVNIEMCDTHALKNFYDLFNEKIVTYVYELFTYLRIE